ncbi:hypothetical protein [Pleomorphomonas sp. JP5]|uniref:hypothetical protein n=1 Tax=Pleomorphomonas sp. JP5 TaxID=2942998 RepID=UPI002044C3A6|nr:hypothetical protein [Pleomorphomonas sp. JP5]MCM5559596.1 hypothetical protein [Pleomorphomonas sp. JP5]
MTSSLIGAGEYNLASKFRPGGDTLVVVFSQVRVPAGKFGLERLFAGTSHSLLLLNQPVNNWYRSCGADIDRLIVEAASTAKAARIILYGSSMGAFGAAAAAARYPDAELYAFAPDFRIGEPGSQSAAAGLAKRSGEADLGELLAVPRRGMARVIVPTYDPYDAGVGARLADLGLPGEVALVPLRSSHEVHDHLYSLNIIRKVTATFRRDIFVEAAVRNLLVSSIDWPAHARFAAARAAFDAGIDLDPDALVGLLPDTNPGLILLAAEAAKRAGDIGRALTLLAGLDAAIAGDGVLSGLAKRYLKEVPRRRIRLLEEVGDIAASRRLASEAASRFPTDEGFAALAMASDGNPISAPSSV